MRSGRGLCIIPKRHVDNYFDLPEHSKTACWIVADRVKMILTDRFGPDGFNIGVNVGSAAGQTVPHAQIHLIPRYAGFSWRSPTMLGDKNLKTTISGGF